MRRQQTLLSLGMAYLLTGCFSQQVAPVPVVNVPVPKVVKETLIDLSITASNNKTPLSLQLFELKSNETFRTLDYFELMRGKESQLNGDLISRNKKILLPNTSINRKIKPSKEVHYYAVIASFKDVEENDKWRFITEIIPESTNTIHLTISQDNIINNNH